MDGFSSFVGDIHIDLFYTVSGSRIIYIFVRRLCNGASGRCKEAERG